MVTLHFTIVFPLLLTILVKDFVPIEDPNSTGVPLPFLVVPPKLILVITQLIVMLIFLNELVHWLISELIVFLVTLLPSQVEIKGKKLC